MSLLYRCDVCGEETEPGDAYGPGVITEVQGQGRPKVWQPESWEITYTSKIPALSVLPILEESDNQICGGCLGQLMREMVETLWPVVGMPECICQPGECYAEAHPELSSGERVQCRNEIGVGTPLSVKEFLEYGERVEIDQHAEARANTPGTEEWGMAQCPSCGGPRARQPFTDCEDEGFHYHHTPKLPYKPFPDPEMRSNHEDTTGGDRADSDVPELRAVEPVPEPSASLVARRCPSCAFDVRATAPAFCTRPAFHSPG
jgi:hypothetical protein